MAIIFNQGNVNQGNPFENATVEEIAKFYISTVDLKSSNDNQKLLVNEFKIKFEYYKGSFSFFEGEYLNEANISKLNKVTGVLQDVYIYSCKFFNNCFNSGKVYFYVNEGEIEIYLESPNKDCSIDFNRQALLRSIKMSQQENLIKEDTARLLSIIPVSSLSSVANINPDNSPKVDFKDSDIHFANDNKLFTESLQNKALLPLKDHKKSHTEKYQESKANQSEQHCY